MMTTITMRMIASDIRSMPPVSGVGVAGIGVAVAGMGVAVDTGAGTTVGMIVVPGTVGMTVAKTE
jgi:hypothetical protein